MTASGDSTGSGVADPQSTCHSIQKTPASDGTEPAPAHRLHGLAPWPQPVGATLTEHLGFFLKKGGFRCGQGPLGSGPRAPRTPSFPKASPPCHTGTVPGLTAGLARERHASCLSVPAPSASGGDARPRLPGVKSLLRSLPSPTGQVATQALGAGSPGPAQGVRPPPGLRHRQPRCPGPPWPTATKLSDRDVGKRGRRGQRTRAHLLRGCGQRTRPL